MVQKKYVVELTAEERTQLLGMVQKGSGAARRLRRAHLLLLADEGRTDDAIAAALHTNRSTVERTRRRFLEGGLDHALTESPRPGATPILDGSARATLVAVACSLPPAGRTGWTMQLLADELVTRQVVPAISADTVRRTLKKTI